MQKEARRFLGALHKRCQLAGSNIMTVAQLYAIANDLDLAVPDMETFMQELNDAGGTAHLVRPTSISSHALGSEALFYKDYNRNTTIVQAPGACTPSVKQWQRIVGCDE
jgi:DNA helicase MCM8